MHDLGSAHPATRPAPDRHPWLHARTDPDNGDRSSRNTTAPPSKTGRSPTQNPSDRRGGRVSPLVLSLGAASRCEPQVSNLGKRPAHASNQGAALPKTLTPIPAPKVRLKGFEPTVSTVGSPPNLTPALAEDAPVRSFLAPERLGRSWPLASTWRNAAPSWRGSKTLARLEP
jgi:hypothetical protein